MKSRQTLGFHVTTLPNFWIFCSGTLQEIRPAAVMLIASNTIQWRIQDFQHLRGRQFTIWPISFLTIAWKQESPPSGPEGVYFCGIASLTLLSGGDTPVLSCSGYPPAGPVIGLWTETVAGLGDTPTLRKDKGPEVGKVPPTSDLTKWKHCLPSYYVRGW